MAFSDALGDDPANTAGNFLGVLGASILSGNRYEPFGNFGQLMAQKNKEMQGQTSRAALKALLIQAGATPEQAEQYSANEGVAKLALQNMENGKTDALIAGSVGPGVVNLGQGPQPAPRMSPAAPGGPAAGAGLNGAAPAPALTGTNAEIQGKFVDNLKAGGLTNPYGLAAVAAYAQHESRYDPKNINGSWSDPSERGQAGTSGGILSWRDDRLNKMRAATKGAEDPVAAQAQFTLKENPELTAALQNAKSPEEANALMADAWKFAGYNRQGGEYAARLATTRSYAGRFASADGQPPVRVADASGAMPAAPVAGLNPAIGMPNGRPQVANNEAQTQVLEGRMGMYPPDVYGVAKPTQTANAADLPAENAVPATTTKPIFDIPPGQTSDTATTRTQVAQRDYTRNKLQAEVQADLQKMAILGTRGDRAKGAIESLKLKVQAAQKYLEPTDAQKILQAAGISTDDPQGQKLLLGAIPGAADTSLQKEYGSYRTQEIGEGRVPLSQIDYDSKLRTAGKTDINIRNDAEKKEEVGRAESVTKFLGGIADSAPATAKRAASLDQLGRLISRTQTAQGTTLKAQLDGIGKELGLSTGELKTKADAINAITNSLAPQMREPGTGTVSDADLRGFLAALPSLSATPEGNQLILGGLKRATDVDRERTKIAAKWQSGKLSASEARSQIAEIDERSIYASESERSLVAGLNPIPENKARSGWRVLGVE